MAQLTSNQTANVATPYSTQTARLYFLDHLRATVILLVILLHASMTYMAFAPEWWYVIEPNGSLSFTYLVLVLDVPIMLILFFIAGFFAYGSLEKYGAGRFMRQKLVRIGIPWVFGVLVLAPLVTYLIPFTRGMEISFLQFWTNDFWGVFYQQSVYWFLGILLLLFGILAALYRYEPRLSDVERSNAAPTPSFLWTFWGLTSVWFFVATLVMPADTWQNAARVFVFQPARLLLYGGYFALGIYADRRGWLRPGGYLPDLGQWAPAMLISGAAYLGLRIIWQDGNLLFLVAQAALFNTFCLTATFAALSFFQQVSNGSSAVWDSLSRNAYAIYYLHPLVLYPAAYLALSVDAPPFVEVVGLTILTALVCWAIGALVLTRLPVLRNIF